MEPEADDVQEDTGWWGKTGATDSEGEPTRKLDTAGVDTERWRGDAKDARGGTWGSRAGDLAPGTEWVRENAGDGGL